tara:strand:+ start:317 stop:634 length:318 start_codon:yes stop_codon:yes gene_type:complete
LELPQVKVYKFHPVVDIVIDSLPEADFSPDQAPPAEQDCAVEFHDNTTVEPIDTFSLSAEKGSSFKGSELLLEADSLLELDSSSPVGVELFTVSMLELSLEDISS